MSFWLGGSVSSPVVRMLLSNLVFRVETVAFYFLAGVLLWKGWRSGRLPRFPFFHIYLSYMVATGLALWIIYWLDRGIYPGAAWARLLTSLVAEFVVLLEISDHLFIRFVAVRRLGRLIALVVCAAFFLAYVAPALSEPHNSRELILEFFKRASLTKAVIIVALLAACRFYRLPLERGVCGILIGFSVFLTSNVVNSTLGQQFSPAVIERAFGIIGPVSYTLGMLVWTVALWNPKPALAAQPASAEGRPAVGLELRLEKLNTTLTRLLRR